jgi:hypothetical protein
LSHQPESTIFGGGDSAERPVKSADARTPPSGDDDIWAVGNHLIPRYARQRPPRPSPVECHPEFRAIFAQDFTSLS